MTKRNAALLATLIVAGPILVGLGAFYFKELRGIGPAVKSPPDDIGRIIEENGARTADGENRTDFPLEIAEGFEIGIFADDLPDARVIVQDGRGNFLVSQPDEGQVTLLETNADGVTNKTPILTGLERPHGLAIDPQDGLMLYVAEEHRISRVRLYSDGDLEPIADLPAGGRHWSRTIAFGPDGRLYVSVGSSCDTCHEDDARRAAIYAMDRDGSNFEAFATGLRNTVFFDWHPVDGAMWGTDMGRDHLGDNLPPDEINIIREGGDYGWPECYGKQVPDTRFDSGLTAEDCSGTQPSHIDLEAHVAPLGIDFVPEEGWPEEYWYDAIVALHGSWNRSEPVGYKLLRVKLDAQGNPLGTEDFISGWLTDEGALGRPVDVVTRPGGIMYVTDDKAGIVYRITKTSGEGAHIAPQAYADDNVRLDTIGAQSTISRPVTITGEARGTMFFEADFPVRVLDANGEELGVGIARAEGEWMTERFVPFEATVAFDAPETETGILRLERDNPSGLAEHDLSIDIPIRFDTLAQPDVTRESDGCMIGGCSGELCIEAGAEPAVSNCIYKQEFACYESARCGRDENDDCAWLPKDEVAACLESHR